MATKIVGGVAVDLIARTAKWVQGFRTAKKHQDAFTRQIRAGAAQIATYAASYLAVRNLANAFDETRQAIDRLAKTSARLQISTQAMAAFSLAARKAGSSTQEITQALTYMTRNIGEATLGNAEMVRTFQRLNLDVQKLAKLAPDQQYKLVADAIRRLGSASAQTSVTMDIFGRSGANALNLIKQGAAAIEDAEAKTKAYGTAIERDAASKVERMNDALTDMREQWEGLKTQLVVHIAPVFERMSKSLVEYVQAMKLQRLEMNLAAGRVSGLDAMRQIANIMGTPRSTTSGAAAQVALPAGGMGGGAYGESAARVRALSERYAAMDTAETAANQLAMQLRTQEEILRESYEQRMEIIDEAERLQVETQMSYSDMRLRLEQENERRITEAARQETLRRRQLYVENAQFIINGLQEIASTASMSAREQFEITKALKMAETVVNTCAAIMRYHSEGRIGMAWTAGIIGAAQLATIAATTFEGGGTVATAAPPMPAQDSDSGAVGSRAMPTVNLVLGGGGRYSRDEVVSILTSINEAVGDGFHLNVS